jgi:hypothetical protein
MLAETKESTKSEMFKRPWGRIASSPSLLAVVVLILLNLALVSLNPLASFDPEKLPAAHSWIYWAAEDFRAQPQPANVVLLGSSLLVNPICAQEANFLQKEVDSVVNHRCRYLESRLQDQAKQAEEKRPLPTPLRSSAQITPQAQAGPSATCFNFALPGSLMSDNYMILRTLLNGPRSPKMIVLGLALRDFIDNEVPCAAATPVFRYLERYTDVSDIVDLAMPETWQRLEFSLRRHVYLLRKKLDVQSALSQFADANLRQGLQSGYSSCLLNQFDMSCYVPSLRSDIERNVWISKPNDCQPVKDNVPEYKRRYRTANYKLFQCQKVFLEKFLAEAKSRGIKILIINLPTTREHLTLMPQGAYSQYLEVLRAAENRFHTPFLDLNDDRRFYRADFVDTCHMRGSGGKKLLDCIAQEVRKNPELAKCLEISRDNPTFTAASSTIY